MSRAHSALEPRARPRATLLLVDDDPLITEALAFALGSDYDVQSCATRLAAIALLRGLEQPPQLALVDLGLPPTLKRMLARALEAPSAEGDELIGESAALLRLKSHIAQFAPAPYPVLIEGESGSGKGLA